MFLSSYETVRAHVNSLLCYFGNNAPLSRIAQNDLERYVANCRTDTYTRKEGGKLYTVSNATINRRLSAFQGMHTKAVKSWKVAAQPIDFKALKLKERAVVNNTLARDVMRRVFNESPEHLQRFIMITLYLGWRKTNVLTLRGKQIDLATRTVKTIGKGGKAIVSPISDSFLRYIKQNGLHKLDRIITFDGRPVKDIRRAWRGALRRAGVGYIRPHDLRHTFGTWLYESTGDQRLVQELLHHSDIKTSIRYTHTKQEAQRKRLSDAMKLDFCRNGAKQGRQAKLK